METRNTKSTAEIGVESQAQPLRLSGMAAPELEFDLSTEIEQLRTKESRGRVPGRSSVTLVRQHDLRVILILMKANQRLGEHRAEGRISIQTIAGRICVHLQGRKIDLPAGRFLALQRGQHHDVESPEESAFLLIITWPAEKRDRECPARSLFSRDFSRQKLPAPTHEHNHMHLQNHTLHTDSTVPSTAPMDKNQPAVKTSGPAPQTTVMNHMTIVSRLLLNAERDQTPEAGAANREEARAALARFDQADFPALVKFAGDHHVLVRAFEIFSGLANGKTTEAVENGILGQALATLDHERARIAHALLALEKICSEFEAQGLRIVVIKTLDHWPDLGSDLDLYTDADPAAVRRIMTQDFQAVPEERSWGDRLAGKWNFKVPGLPELVEFHVGRLGQTGEHVALARDLIERAEYIQIGGRRFCVPAPPDRLMISTLQRMYRHFYFRLCDIVDTVHLLEHRHVDFPALRASAMKSGIWPGTATYLTIASDYLTQTCGRSLALPSFVWSASQFGGDEVTFRKGFLRVPIMPHSVNLFASQFASTAGSRNLRGAARLSLLPWLATAAAVCYKLSGSDKGIW